MVMVYTNDNYYGGSTKGTGALGGVDQGTIQITEKDEHEIPIIQAFTPTPSND
jgi:hypothetical protein